MQTAELYGIRFSETQASQRSTRVGLLHGRTGVPLFVLYLESIESPIEFQCHSNESLEIFASQLTSPRDRHAVHGLRLFFAEGGSVAQIAASPLRDGLPSSRLEQMLGRTTGFKRKTGLHLAKNAIESADLLVVPQARELLSASESVAFHEQMLSVASETGSLFALIEGPQDLDPSRVAAFTKNLSSPDAAFYYPTLVAPNGGGEMSELSVLPAVAAHYQITDAERSLAELPTFHAFRSGAVPSLHLSPSQQMELLSHRSNTVVFTPGTQSQVRVWGGHTLARPPQMEFALIPVRRTLRALREALESLAEAFVLEPLSTDIVLESEYRLRAFFEENRKLFDLYTKSPFSVTTARLNGKTMDGIEINCAFRLSRCVQELRLNFGVSS